MRGVHITLRMRLQCVVMRKGQQLIPPVEVLNEVVVDRGSNPFLTKIECWEHNRLLTKVGLHSTFLQVSRGGLPSTGKFRNKSAGWSLLGAKGVLGILASGSCDSSQQIHLEIPAAVAPSMLTGGGGGEGPGYCLCQTPLRGSLSLLRGD